MLREDFELGRGHAMAMVHVIRNGPTIGDTHFNSGRTHSDDSDTLRLNVLKNR